MLKHATINRTSRAQQTLQLRRHQQQQPLTNTDNCDELDGPVGGESLSPNPTVQPARSEQDVNNNNNVDNNFDNGACLTPPQLPFVSCTPSPTPSSLLSTPSKLQLNPLSSLQSSPMSSPVKRQLALSSTPAKQVCSSSSMIKIFAQTLSQDVEYVTLHVNTQTKSNQIIKSLLRKFRLKHRDPNLFYLTLERWIRVDGLKVKSVMLLADEHCPLQLQQCCSNPPHNDIKFTLQIRSGALVKIFCSDVAPDTRYKCLSLSTQTTTEETMDLMLHCLNLVGFPTSTSSNQHQQLRQSGSPSSTDSSDSSNSSSSGIESDQPNCLQTTTSSNTDRTNHHLLDSNSRASSVTSISSVSDLSNLSSGITDQYCLVIECKDLRRERVLEPDEYIVEVYQNLQAEAREQSLSAADSRDVQACAAGRGEMKTDNLDSSRQHPEQWFCFKLKKRADLLNNNHENHSNSSSIGHSGTIKFAHPRHNLPLPPIPLATAAQLHNDFHDLRHIVSTTQIEVNYRPGSSASQFNGDEKRHLLSNEQQPRLPPQYIFLPPVRPRRRNLSNASSTFCRTVTDVNKRRYDPAQLAADLKKLDVKCSEGPTEPEQKPEPEPRTVLFDAIKRVASHSTTITATNDIHATTGITTTS